MTNYSTLSDEELVTLYNQKKQQPLPSITDYSAMSDEELTSLYNKKQSVNPEVSQSAPQEQSLGQKLDRRVSDIVEANKDYSLKGIATNVFFPSAAIKTAGAVAGGIGDVLSSGLSTAYEGLVTENIQKGISEKLPSLLEPIAPVIKGITEAYGSLKQSYPEAAKLVEAGANIASILPVGKMASLGKQVAGRGIEAASLSVAKQKGADILRQEASNTIKTEFPKIFKMPSSLKKDYRASKQFLEKADNSMYDIVKNEHPDFPIKGSGNAPLTNYAENLTMRKQQNWDEIEGMIKNTGIDTQIAQKEFIGELQKVINTSGVSSVTETEKRSALKMMESITENPNITLGDAQAQLQGLNKALGGSIPYDVAGTAKIDNMYRDFLKKTIDAKVQALPDNAGFKDLKKLWGSHRSVEDTIVKTLNDSLGKSQKLNFIDITSGSLALSSILTANPHMLLSVGMGEALNIARRLSGDVNRSLVKLTDRVRKSQTMESKVREALSKNKSKADVFGIRGKP